MTPGEALAFVCTHGLALESGTGPAPSLVAAVVGGPVRGSWWAHERGREIYALTRAIRHSPDVLVCRLIDGKITYVHRRLWPALVRLAERFPASRLAQIHEVHTASGKHSSEEIRFPDWVPPDIVRQAAALDDELALAELKYSSAMVDSDPQPARRKRARDANAGIGRARRKRSRELKG